MDNFKETVGGYDKQEVNDFVNYVIKKTEENVTIIREQSNELNQLRSELSKYHKLENTFYDIKRQADVANEQIRRNAEKQAELIIKEAKDNASKIVNDALIKAEKVEQEKEMLNISIHNYKKKIRNTLMEQLDALEDIEML